MYVDVHTHLTHKQFDDDKDLVIERAVLAGVGRIVVNGLEPTSNREVLELARQYEPIRAAVGIYPVDGVWDQLPESLPFSVVPFDVEAEISWIREQAERGLVSAIGECGLDGHWLKENSFQRQEQIFRKLVRIAMEFELPVIIHTRKLERKSIEILRDLRPERVIFHCYGGKSRWAMEVAKDYGWCFSIPANAARHGGFTKLLKTLPQECVLTETDAPFMGPASGQRSESAFVVQTIALLAELRGYSMQSARDMVWSNYQRLFKE